MGSDAPRKVLVAKNRLRKELDIFWDRSGLGIRFRDNRCRTSTRTASATDPGLNSGRREDPSSVLPPKP